MTIGVIAASRRRSRVRPIITGVSFNFGATVTIPAHNVGDLIVIHALRAAAAAPVIPSAGGTVPAWVNINNSGVSNPGARIVYFVATANNHTSGTWTATYMVAIVISGAKAVSPIGGAGDPTDQQTASSTTSATSPALTLSSTDGSSLLLHSFIKPRVTAWDTPPVGYTAAVAGSTDAVNYGAQVLTKTDTSTDGAVTQTMTTSGAAAVGRAVSIEILAP